MPPALPPETELRPSDFRARLPRRARGIGAGSGTGSDVRRGFALVGHHRGRRAAALLAAVAVPAIAAPHEWRALQIGNAETVAVTVEPMPFEQAGRSFPGSAFYYLASDTVPARDGALDSGARWDNEAAVGPAARSLRAAGSAVDQSRALTCLTQAIYYEAASEPDAGQRAVAQVVLNRVAHPAYPGTICGVVYQGSEKPTGCQFTFTCDGALARLPSRLFWLRAEAVARAALAGYVYRPVGLATHYHTIAVHPYWADSLNFIGTIGSHRFYRFGGPAGASASFNTAAYVGGEPMAAPRHQTGTSPAADPDPIAIEQAFAQGYTAAGYKAAAMPAALAMPARSLLAPAYSAALQARGGDALYIARALPEAAGIRPEYANSGQWIVRPGS